MHRMPMHRMPMHRWTGWGALMGLLVIGGGAIALPIAARAQSVTQSVGVSATRFTLTLEHEAEESYTTLERRAEAAARAATQRRFDSDILIRAVAVTIVAENRGLAAPVLTLQVTRDQWRQLPDPQRWSTYYPTAQALLQLRPSATAPAESTLPQVPGTPTLP